MNLTTEYGYGMVVEELNLKPNFVPILMTHLVTENRRKMIFYLPLLDHTEK